MRRSRPVTTDTTSTTPLPAALDDLLQDEVEPRGARHARPQSSWRWAGPAVVAALVLAVSLAGWRLVFHVTAPDPNRLGPLPPAVVEPSGAGPELPVLRTPEATRADRARPRRTTTPPTTSTSATPARTTTRPSPAPTVTVTETTRPPSSPPPPLSPTPTAEVPQP